MSWPSLPRVAAAAAEALRPRRRTSLADWIPATLRLPPELTGDPGALRIDGPLSFLRGIVEAADDVDVREISIVASAQIGKTTTMLAIMLGLSLNSPAPAMLVTPDVKSLRELLERLYAICKISGRELANRLLPKRLRNDLWIDLQIARINLAYSGNKQSLSSKPACRVLMTEVDRYDVRRSSEGDTMALAEERTKMFANRLVIRESTPTLQGKSRICAAYDRSDQREYFIPCPHCGHFQPLHFWPRKAGPYAGRGGIKGMKDGNGAWLSPAEAKRAAYYECERCEGRIEDRHKTAAIERGAWVPRGCSVDVDGKLLGASERPPEHVGFRLSTLYAPADRITFGDVAAKYLESRDKPKKMQSFVNNWLGLPYEERSRRARWEDLRDRLTTAVPRGQVHPEAVFLTAGCDVQGQQNGCYYAVRGWWVREGQCTSCLVEAGRALPRLNDVGDPIPGSDVEQLDALVLNRAWPRFGSDEELPVRLLLIDTGHRTNEIYGWVRARPGSRVRGIKGASTSTGTTPWKRSSIDRSPVDGAPIAGGQDLWLLDVDQFKEDLQDRWTCPQDAPGAWLLSTPAGEAYLRQITNEAPQFKASRNGMVTTWAPIDPNDGVDWWDCEVYARAGAEMVVGPNGWHLLPQLVAAAEAAKAKPEAKPRPRPSSPGPARIDRPGGWSR